MATLALLDLGMPVLVAIAFSFYLLIGAIYRVFFHPLRKIPGPKLAAITHWYEIYYDVIRPGQYNFKILELHKKYGPILRINPDEVHVADKDWLPEIYGARKRNRLYEPSLDTADSVAGTTDYEQHKIRRQAFVNFFSPPTVRRLEPLLAKKRDVLSDVIERSLASSGEMGKEASVLNLSDLFFAYFYDIIQEYAFADPSNVMLDPKEAQRLRNNSNNLLMQVNFTRHFGFVNDMVAFLPRSIQRRLTPPGVVDLHDLAVRVRKNVDEVLKDEKTTAASTGHQSIFYTIRDDATLPESEKHPLRLQREGWFVVVAGEPRLLIRSIN